MSGERADQSSEITTVLICKNPLLRAGLKNVLAGTHFVVSDTVFDETSSPRYYFGTQPALFIVAASGFSEELIETIKPLKARQPEARVVVIANDFSVRSIRLGIEAGVDGFCLAASDREILIRSLELVMLGEKFLSGTLVPLMLSETALNDELGQDRPMAEPSPPDLGTYKLSSREAQILQFLMRGEPNKVIAKKLDVTEATIKVHVKAILRKIGAANRTQAALWAKEHLLKKQIPS